MQKQFKLFKNIKKVTPNDSIYHFKRSNLVGVEYAPNSRNILSVTNQMAKEGFKQFFFTPRHLKHILDVSIGNEKVRISDIEFNVEPEYEVGKLLDAYYKQDNTWNKELSENLINILYDNDAIKMSIYVKETIPVTKINIYQTGLVHISNASNNLDWFDDLLTEVPNEIH
jgi:hypothetical protein